MAKRKILLSQAIYGFSLDAEARLLSPHTIADYQNAFRLLIDTGVRASELCGLELRTIDLRNRAVKVFGKGSKERALPIGPRTKAALAKYIQESRADARVNEPVFLTRQGAAAGPP